MCVYVVNHTMRTETGKPIFPFLVYGFGWSFSVSGHFFKDLYVILCENASDPSVCCLWMPEITLVTLFWTLYLF